MTEPAAPSPRFRERPLTALDAIFTRRSVRAFTEQPLDEPTVRALLDAAVQAPTAMHLEPWVFVIVQDRGALRRISDRAKDSWANEPAHYRELHRGVHPEMADAVARFASPDFCMFYDANTLIAIGARGQGPFVAADCWLAAANLMLAASALGLGSCCVGSAVPGLNRPETKAELTIPSNVEIIAPIIVGVPRGPVTDSARRTPVIVSWKRGQ